MYIHAKYIANHHCAITQDAYECFETAWKRTSCKGPFQKSNWLALGTKAAAAAVAAGECCAAVEVCGALVEAEEAVWERLRDDVLVKAWAGVRP